MIFVKVRLLIGARATVCDPLIGLLLLSMHFYAIRGLACC